jgi:hypothetical protein
LHLRLIPFPAQLVRPLVAPVPVPPISVLRAKVANWPLRENASLPVLRILFPLPVPVSNVTLIARPAPDYPSTNAPPARLPVLSSRMEDVYLHALKLNISTLQALHVKHVIQVALRVPDQVQRAVSHVRAQLRSFVTALVFLQIVKARAASYLGSVYVCLSLCKYLVARERDQQSLFPLLRA